MIATPPDLLKLRREIDRVDSELVQVLARRQKIVEQVIAIKEREGLPAFIPERIEEVLDGVSRQAEAAGLSADLARALWKGMIDWFVAFEEKQLKDS